MLIFEKCFAAFIIRDVPKGRTDTHVPPSAEEIITKKLIFAAADILEGLIPAWKMNRLPTTAVVKYSCIHFVGRLQGFYLEYKNSNQLQDINLMRNRRP